MEIGIKIQILFIKKERVRGKRSPSLSSGRLLFLGGIHSQAGAYGMEDAAMGFSLGNKIGNDQANGNAHRDGNEGLHLKNLLS